MNYNIAIIKGDGIGHEIVDIAVAVLKKIVEKLFKIEEREVNLDTFVPVRPVGRSEKVG